MKGENFRFQSRGDDAHSRRVELLDDLGNLVLRPGASQQHLQLIEVSNGDRPHFAPGRIDWSETYGISDHLPVHAVAERVYDDFYEDFHTPTLRAGGRGVKHPAKNRVELGVLGGDW
jgi:hypothetical protein